MKSEGEPEDEIAIVGLRASARIGATREERGRAQSLEISLHIVPECGFADAAEDLSKTVDYYVVSERVRDLAARGERVLIETLADEVASMVLAEFAAASVVVEVRKFVLADCHHVSARARRTRGEMRGA